MDFSSSACYFNRFVDTCFTVFGSKNFVKQHVYEVCICFASEYLFNESPLRLKSPLYGVFDTVSKRNENKNQGVF